MRNESGRNSKQQFPHICGSRFANCNRASISEYLPFSDLFTHFCANPCILTWCVMRGQTTEGCHRPSEQIQPNSLQRLNRRWSFDKTDTNARRVVNRRRHDSFPFDPIPGNEFRWRFFPALQLVRVRDEIDADRVNCCGTFHRHSD